MKIRFELSEKEIRDMAIAFKPMYEVDGLEHYKPEFEHDLNKIVERICADDNKIIVGHGYRGVVGSDAVKFEFDSRAVEMTALYAAKVMRRILPIINTTVRFVKSMRELIGFTSETLKTDANEFSKRFNRAFPVEREWRLVSVEQAHAACLYERVSGSSDWTSIQWSTGWNKIDEAMEVVDLHPAYQYFADEEAAKAAFHSFLNRTNDPCNCDAQPKENAPKQEHDEFDNDLYL